MPARTLRLGVVLLALVVFTACSSRQRLHEYDYRNRTLAVTTIAPAHPDVFSGLRIDFDRSRVLESIVRTSSNVAREAAALRMQARLDSAAARVDVSGRLGTRVLQGASRHLRTTPVRDARRADYELEILVRSYGLVASSWHSQAYFTIDCEVRLLDGATGRRIWKQDVHATDIVRPAVFGRTGRNISGAVTAIALANMSAAEIERALAGLSDFAGDFLVRELAESLDDARD
jgi:hypothetical protein